MLKNAGACSTDPPGLLLRRLSWIQIFMICIGGTVGVGFARSSGEILAIAGPGGVLIAFVVVGVVAICVMEGICEMINLWPISNAMIEFVRAFVDEDLAIVVGFTYWYAYCCALAALIIAAGSLLQYYNISSVLLNCVYVICMLSIFVINCFGVLWFGWIELWGGVLKLLLLLGIFALMMCINGGVNTGHSIGATPFIDGVRNNPNVAASHGIAILIAIPLAVFAYIGIELVTVTAFEAKNPADLRWPAKNIAYFILIIYALTIGGISANVEWFDKNLPQFYSQPLISTFGADNSTLGHYPIIDQTKALLGTSFAPVIATLEAGASYVPVANVLLAFLVYSALSCANANLYVASRTLYGLTRDLNLASNNWFESLFAHLNIVTVKWRVPLWSIIASIALVASWLPFVKLGLGETDLFQIMSSIGSVGVLLVWASQCLAFIRYHKWLWIHKEELDTENYRRFNRWPMTNEFSSYFAAIQPFPAYLGLISCLAIVFLFNSAGMWNGNQLLLKGLNIYLGPAISLLLFIILKIIRWEGVTGGWVVLSDDWAELHKRLDKLNSLANHADVTHHNSAVYPMLGANGREQAYSIDTDQYQQSSPPGSTAYYTAEGAQPMQRADPRHASVQYSMVSEVDAVEAPRGPYFPQGGPVSPDERAYPYTSRYEQQY